MAKPAHRHHSVRALQEIARRMIKGMEEHSTARRLQAELNRLALGAEALNNVAANRSPLDTPEAHALKVGRMSKKFDAEVSATINRAADIWREGRRDAERRIDEKVNLKPDAFAAEIRAAFRGMDSKARHKLISELVDGNRGPELAALVKAPTSLTGLPEQERAAYEKAIMARHASAELEELQQLDGLLESVTTVTFTAGKFARSLTDPAQLAQIERDAAEAEAAGAAFAQSLEPRQ